MTLPLYLLVFRWQYFSNNFLLLRYSAIRRVAGYKELTEKP